MFWNGSSWVAEGPAAKAVTGPTVTGFGYDFLYDTRTNGNAGLVSAAGRKKAAYFAFKNG